MSEKLSISQWAEEDKPREKLERLGAAALSNAELLAILIGSGSQDESAVDLMKHIMSDCDNNLNSLGKMTIKELTRYKGMGPAKAITILAACELGKRRALDKLGNRPDLGSSLAIYNYMLPKMQDLDTEEAWVLMMNHSSLSTGLPAFSAIILSARNLRHTNTFSKKLLDGSMVNLL